jgi:copper chaperone CopZ
MMRSTIAAAVAAIAVVGSMDAGAQATRPAEQERVTLRISGMQCSVCAATVERVAKRLAGVTDARADQPAGTAAITYDPSRTNPAAIARLLAKRSGFAVEVPPAPK